MSAYNHARPPSPGDDASPFLLRVYVTRGLQWRHMSQFEHGNRPTDDEFKLYVWRSTTLRSLAHMLHAADPTISKPLSPHSFRLVYYNSHTNRFASRELGRNVTRISMRDLAGKSSAASISKGGGGGGDGSSRVPGVETDAEAYLRALVPPSAAPSAASPTSRSPPRASSPPRRNATAADGGDGSMKLSEFDIVDGDLIECMIRPVPPRTAAHAPPSRMAPSDFGRPPALTPSFGPGSRPSSSMDRAYPPQSRNRPGGGRDALAVRPTSRGYDRDRDRDGERGPPRGRGNFAPLPPPARPQERYRGDRERASDLGSTGGPQRGYGRGRERELSPEPRGRGGGSRGGGSRSGDYRSRELDRPESRDRGASRDGDSGRGMDLDHGGEVSRR